MARRKQPVIPDALPATDGSGSEGLDGRDLAPRSYISPLLLQRSYFNAPTSTLGAPCCWPSVAKTRSAFAPHKGRVYPAFLAAGGATKDKKGCGAMKGRRIQRGLLFVAAIAIAVILSHQNSVAQEQVIIGGQNGQAIFHQYQSGQSWCYVSTQTIIPNTNVVENQWCKCVARLLGSGRDPRSGEAAVVVDLGPEILCYPGPANAQQDQQIRQRISQLNQESGARHAELQSLSSSTCNDPYRYYNDPGFRAWCDSLKPQRVQELNWQLGQIAAEIAAHNHRLVAPRVGPPSAPPAPGPMPTPPTVNPCPDRSNPLCAEIELPHQ